LGIIIIFKLNSFKKNWKNNLKINNCFLINWKIKLKYLKVFGKNNIANLFNPKIFNLISQSIHLTIYLVHQKTSNSTKTSKSQQNTSVKANQS
jgi:hypothetical protein